MAGRPRFHRALELACALDRPTLLSAGSERKVGALFAQGELNRSFCGQRDPILASTPKYTLLWKALEARAAARHRPLNDCPSRNNSAHYRDKSPPLGN